MVLGPEVHRGVPPKFPEVHRDTFYLYKKACSKGANPSQRITWIR